MRVSLSNTVKSQISKVLWITLGWTVISVLYFFSIYIILIDLDCDISDMDPWLYFKGNLMTGVLAGIIGGSDVVLDSKGEIYQYVGDEIVISWKTQDLRGKKEKVMLYTV